MSQKEQHDAFVLLLIGAQTRLYAYIRSLVLDGERASDILQQTNLVLLDKESDFQHGSSFNAWSCRVAFYEVLADRRRRHRDKHLFSDELLAMIASHNPEGDPRLDERSAALDDCLRQLKPNQKKMILDRYRAGGGVAALAEELDKSAAAVSAMLYRIRAALLDCVQRKLSGNPSP